MYYIYPKLRPAVIENTTGASMTEHRRSARRRTKDKVLQARIPHDLDTELRGRAEKLGLSVSTVVRNVLLNTFSLVEDVVADSAQLARAIHKEERSLAADSPADAAREAGEKPVLGWQELVLNRNGICEECNAILRRGEPAAVGLPVAQRPVLLCRECLAALSPALEKALVVKEPSADKKLAGRPKKRATRTASKSARKGTATAATQPEK
ncbi:MAG: antitoxin component of RelBE/YafQ-DinJ toxin-antitoxin module [Halieaceae bacterium]